MTKREFVQRIETAVRCAVALGAQINIPVTCAQAALESGWGNSGLTRRANNLFGIKAGSSWRGPVVCMPTREYDAKNKRWITVMARWRAYYDWVACVMDYARIIATLPWYRDALAYVDNPDMFLHGLLPRDGEPGWATDPQYFSKVRAAAAEIERLGGPKW